MMRAFLLKQYEDIVRSVWEKIRQHVTERGTTEDSYWYAASEIFDEVERRMKKSWDSNWRE